MPHTRSPPTGAIILKRRRKSFPIIVFSLLAPRTTGGRKSNFRFVARAESEKSNETLLHPFVCFAQKQKFDSRKTLLSIARNDGVMFAVLL
jgi:hypothetical protein